MSIFNKVKKKLDRAGKVLKDTAEDSAKAVESTASDAVKTVERTATDVVGQSEGVSMKDKWTNQVTGQMYDATQIKVPGHLIFELSNSIGISGHSNGHTLEEALVFELSRIYGLDCLECRKSHDALHPTHCEGKA